MGELTLRPVPTPTGRAAGPTPLNALGDNILTTSLDKVTQLGPFQRHLAGALRARLLRHRDDGHRRPPARPLPLRLGAL